MEFEFLVTIATPKSAMSAWGVVSAMSTSMLLWRTSVRSLNGVQDNHALPLDHHGSPRESGGRRGPPRPPTTSD